MSTAGPLTPRPPQQQQYQNYASGSFKLHSTSSTHHSTDQEQPTNNTTAITRGGSTYVSPYGTPRGAATGSQMGGTHNTTMTTTVRMGYEALDLSNRSIQMSRDRFHHQQESRVQQLEAQEGKRRALREEQHLARMDNMSERLVHLANRETIDYSTLAAVRAAQQDHTIALKMQEIERRRAFDARRQQRLAERADVAQGLRVEVYKTPAENRSAKQSPRLMSREVARRVLPPHPVAALPTAVDDVAQEGKEGEVIVGETQTNEAGDVTATNNENNTAPAPSRAPAHPPNSPRGSRQPPLTSKEALAQLQAQRDAKVEHQRQVQSARLAERKAQREEHVEALRDRLDHIIQKARAADSERLGKRQDQEERIRQWRWRKEHALRAEALDRLERQQRQQQQEGAASSNNDVDDRQHDSNRPQPQSQHKEGCSELREVEETKEEATPEPTMTAPPSQTVVVDNTNATETPSTASPHQHEVLHDEESRDVLPEAEGRATGDDVVTSIKTDGCDDDAAPATLNDLEEL